MIADPWLLENKPTIYWNMLLPGRRIPLVGSRMSTSGKRMDVLAHAH